MELHFLDVGVEQYGDCILVRDDDVSILIDGAHKNDIDGSPGIASLPDQIRAVLGVATGPVPISLLIVTHCHGDHIGCLPEMVGAA
jgi:glyoxylase-like metal-dependent hydrolase (beta-lactamase superfamily II)